ncbi:MAG: hypothetical protein WDA16_06360 [Candidatus Thermoplasmatota archaeon]
MRIMPSDQLSALATGRIDDITPEEKQLALLKVGERLVDQVFDAHIAEGVEPSPLAELYHRERIKILSEAPAAEIRVRVLRALERNITPLLRKHHAWRHEHDGNVVWEFSGPTGTGKSSCMLGLMERLNHVRPEDLAKHVTIDVPQLSQLLPRLSPGSAVAIDEQTHAVGEGSITQAKVLRSMEDQIRMSGIDIYWASPESQDHATSQGELVAFGANFAQKYTRFLVYLNDLPLGYANLPWCSSTMWAAYQPIKKKNVERALRASFQATESADEQIRRLFELESVQAACRVRRLKVGDWRRFTRRFSPSLGTAQVQTMAEEIDFMLETLATRPDDFVNIYGWEATPRMHDAAAGGVEPDR